MSTDKWNESDSDFKRKVNRSHSRSTYQILHIIVLLQQIYDVLLVYLDSQVYDHTSCQSHSFESTSEHVYGFE